MKVMQRSLYLIDFVYWRESNGTLLNGSIVFRGVILTRGSITKRPIIHHGTVLESTCPGGR
jgi:hypothetical protein